MMPLPSSDPIYGSETVLRDSAFEVPPAPVGLIAWFNGSRPNGLRKRDRLAYFAVATVIVLLAITLTLATASMMLTGFDHFQSIVMQQH